MRKLKKNLIFLLLVGIVFYGYSLAYLGILSGYLSAKFFSGKKENEKPKFFRSLIIRIKDYKIHFHHWLCSSFLLVLTMLFRLPVLSNKIAWGFLLGVAWQGISCYRDWKVIIKK